MNITKVALVPIKLSKVYRFPSTPLSSNEGLLHLNHKPVCKFQPSSILKNSYSSLDLIGISLNLLLYTKLLMI